jgi:hypothetical protein
MGDMADNPGYLSQAGENLLKHMWALVEKYIKGRNGR